MSRHSALRRGLLVVVVILSNLVTMLNPDAGQAAHRHRQKQDINADVVRGNPVPDGKYPFIAAIGVADSAGNLKKWFCGGSLIAPSYVLTAAHCVAGVKVQTIAVVVGQAAFATGQGETRTLTDITIHPGFSRRTLNNDVAVLQLNAPILSIAPLSRVGSGNSTFDVAGTALTVVGWGNTVRSSHSPDPTRYPARLKEGAISVVDGAKCAKQWHRVHLKKQFSSTLLLCTSARRFGSGDSGSPVFITMDGTPTQVSLVSGGFVNVKNSVSDFGPRLSAPAIAAFIIASVGV